MTGSGERTFVPHKGYREEIDWSLETMGLSRGKGEIRSVSNKGRGEREGSGGEEYGGGGAVYSDISPLLPVGLFWRGRKEWGVWGVVRFSHQCIYCSRVCIIVAHGGATSQSCATTDHLCMHSMSSVMDIKRNILHG